MKIGVWMITKYYVFYLFLFIFTIDFLLFVFLLIKKIVMKYRDKKKKGIYDFYVKKIEDYIGANVKSEIPKPSGYLEEQVLQELILEYSSFLEGNGKERLLAMIDKDKLKEKTMKNIRSKNPWKQRIGAYEAGVYVLKEATTDLVKLLDTDDKELFNVVSRSLIKLEGRQYLWDILVRASKSNIIDKNNILALIELVDEDIVDILENCLDLNSVYMNILALEVFGKRQYVEGIKWIKKMTHHPLKEVRISALKGATALGDIGERKYLDRILSLKADKEWEVRTFVAKFLNNVKGIESIKTLAELMNDPNWFVRHNAASSLMKQGEEGLRALVGILESDDSFATDKAWEIIQKEIYFYQLLEKVKDKDLKEKINKKLLLSQLEGGLRDDRELWASNH